MDGKLGAFDRFRREEDFVEYGFRPILPGIPGARALLRLDPSERSEREITVRCGHRVDPPLFSSARRTSSGIDRADD